MKYLDDILRIYSFDYNRVAKKSVKNKYGEWVSVYNRFPIQKGEVSFTSKKILFSLGDGVEEFMISDPIVSGLRYYEADYIAYKFKVITWKAFYRNVCVFSYDSINNMKYNTLSGKGVHTPTLTLLIQT